MRFFKDYDENMYSDSKNQYNDLLKKFKRLADLVILKDAMEAAFDDMSTEQYMSCIGDQKKVEVEMLQLAKEIDAIKI